MVRFAGYELPVNYPTGILKRASAHPGGGRAVRCQPHGADRAAAESGALTDAAAALERLVPMDVLGLKPGRQRYGLFTDEAGGILDDLMFANRGDHLLLVVNAACKAADSRTSRPGLATGRGEPLERGLLALQGPKAEAVLAEAPARTWRACGSWTSARSSLAVCPRWCRARAIPARTASRSRSPARDTADLAVRLLASPDVQPVGLGARDSLRLEGGSASTATTSTRHHPGRGGAGVGDPAGPPGRRRARAAFPAPARSWARSPRGRRVRQDVSDQRGLSGTEKAGHDGTGHARGRIAHSISSKLTGGTRAMSPRLSGSGRPRHGIMPSAAPARRRAPATSAAPQAASRPPNT